MIHVYIDPSAYVHLNNELFGKDPNYNRNDALLVWRYLKEYCLEKNISVQTIDFWPARRQGGNLTAATSDDIYVSFDHKILLRKWYWKLKSKKYPKVNLSRFSRKILFQFEPPNVMPEIRFIMGNRFIADRVLRVYDKVFFSWKVVNPKIRDFLFPQVRDGIFTDLWEKKNRRFLTLINTNRKTLLRHKELLTERVKAIIFFSKTGDIDLYGFDWESPPLFPYWFSKNAITKVYKGSVDSKHEKLSEYTFTLAFENCELPGYITEKFFDCLYVGTIPIYLGAPDIAEYVPSSCFIDMRSFKNYKELSTYLKSLRKEQIQEYKEQGRRFLESEQYKPFTKEHFADVFVKACLRNTK